MVWEELKDSLILTEINAKSYEDVMHQLGYVLVKEGYAKESYIDALIEREKNYPTGIDVNGIGVAIPHTDTSHVNKTGIAIGVLKQPVTFVQMGTDDATVDVQLVFIFSVVNPNEHIELLQRIITIIQDKDVLDKLIKARNKNEIIKIIKEKENEI